jgi:O-antigen ligase
MRAAPPALAPAIGGRAAVAAVLATAERLLALAVLVLMSEAVVALLIGPQPDEGSADFRAAILGKPLRGWWLATHIMVLALATPNLMRVLGAATATPLPLAIAGMALLSTLWSTAASETSLRSLMLASSTVFGLYLAARFEPRALLLLLRDAFLVLVALNLAAVMLWPDAALMTVAHPGAWRGLLNHKNGLGLIALLAGLVFVTCRYGRVGKPAIALAGLTGAVLLLVGSTSAGALVTALLLMLVGLFVAWRRASARHSGLVLILAVATAVATALLGLMLAGDILVLLGRDPTLTGRTELWSAVWERVQQHPALGHGYGAIWGTDDTVAAAIRWLVGWPVPDAHSGYLNLALELGLLGLALLVASLGSSLARAIGLIGHADRVLAIWAILLVVFVALHSIFEARLVSHRGLLWPLYVATTVYIARYRH